MSWGGGRCVSAWYLGFPNRRFDLHKPEVDSAHVTKENLPKIERYMGKISGPLLDRIDLHIEVPAVAFKNLCTAPPGNSSDAMRQDVLAARSIQGQRFDDARRLGFGSSMRPCGRQRVRPLPGKQIKEA
jgi:hypothetical protein